MHAYKRARAPECTTHVSSINSESFCTPVLRTQFTTTPLSPSSALHYHFLHSPLRYTPAPSFPGFFLREHNHRFPTLVLALESLSGKCPSLFHVRRSRVPLPVQYIWGTWRAQLYATHIARGPNKTRVIQEVERHSKTASSVLRLRRNKKFFFFIFSPSALSPFLSVSLSFFFFLCPLPLFMLRV